MKFSERFALDEHLSDYPRDKTFDDVIDMIIANDEAISVWQVMENLPMYEIAENIDNTREHFEQTVDCMKWGIDLASVTEEEAEQETKEHTK